MESSPIAGDKRMVGKSRTVRADDNTITQASRGEQVLLKKVLEVIKSPFDLHQGQFQTGTDHSSPLSPLGDPKFKWIHRISELHKSKHDNWLNDLEHMKGI
jgi:hypothetical protein